MNIYDNINMSRRPQVYPSNTYIDRPLDQWGQNRGRSRVASLAPYLVEIERRKKMRSVNKQSRKNLNQNSARSFRIHQKSASSLHKELIKTRDITNPQLFVQAAGPRRSRRTSSVQQREPEGQISRTIDSKHPTNSSQNSFFNDLYARVKQRNQQQKVLRRRQYQTLEQQRAKSQQTGELNMYKVTSGAGQSTLSRKEVPESKKPNKPKGQFRRNKYEVITSQEGRTSAAQVSIQAHTEPEEQQHYIQMTNLRQANPTSNYDMDRMVQNQLSHFYRAARQKEVTRSIEKETEQYFSHSYRPIKSKNQIEIYLSTIANPSLQKASKSTKDHSEPAPKRPENRVKNACLVYDFQFAPQECIQEHREINQKGQGEFERDRQRVERENFHKEPPRLGWSEDECRIDDL